MTVVAGADLGDIQRLLTENHAWRLLHNDLEDRWTTSDDRSSEILRYALLPAGKLIRPLLSVLCAEAVGATAEQVLPGAIALEYVHVATLVHDDIIDADDMRRGRPSVPAAFGTPDAIVAGDRLIFEAFTTVLRCRETGVPADRIATAIAALSDAGSDMCRGQTAEAQQVGDLTGGVEDYLTMARLKTGALFRAACHVGAALGGADDDVAHRLADYGEQLGIAFQIRDDLLAYSDLAQHIGKPVTSDVNNGRPTLPVLLAWQHGTEAQRGVLLDVLHARSGDPAAMASMATTLRDTGAIDRAADVADEHTRRALDRLTCLEPSPSAELLTAIARWTSARPR